MQGELTVADAVSSRYRGMISTEIVKMIKNRRIIWSVSDLERMT